MNKYKYHLRLIFMALTVLGLQACYEDKGNYDYHEINELTFRGIESEYLLRTGETLTIHPEIEGTLDGGSGDYSYEWVRLGGSVVSSSGVTSSVNEIVLESTQYLEDYRVPLVAGTYNFYYRVTDNATGVKWSSQLFKVILTNIVEKGILMMYEAGSETKLAFLNYAASTKKFNLMNLMTDEMPELGKPIAVHTYTDNHSPYISCPTTMRYSILIHTETGAYNLSHIDFSYSYTPSYNIDRLIIGNKPADFSIKQIYSGNGKASSNQLALRNNNDDLLFYQTGPASTLLMLYDIPINRVLKPDPANPEEKILTRIPISDKLEVYSSGRVYFDTESRSFCYNAENVANMVYFEDSNDPEEPFKWNNTNSDLIYITSKSSIPTTPVTPGVFYALLKDITSGQLSLISFQHSSARKKLWKQSEINDATNIKSAVEYEMCHTNNSLNIPFFYYRTDKEIYLYDTSDKTHKKIYPLNGETLPANVKISMMKILYTGGVTAEFADHMAIFMYDETKPEASCGSLEVYSIADTAGTLTQAQSGLDNEKVDMKWSGLFGKIISADWKNK